MKVKDLIDALSKCDEELDVVVETVQAGVPIRRKVGIKSARRGFDWTNGMFIINPEEGMVVAKLSSRNVKDIAKERLEQLKDAHAKLGFKFIPKSRENDWIDGCVEGIKMNVASCGGLDTDDK